MGGKFSRPPGGAYDRTWETPNGKTVVPYAENFSSAASPEPIVDTNSSGQQAVLDMRLSEPWKKTPLWKRFLGLK